MTTPVMLERLIEKQVVYRDPDGVSVSGRLEVLNRESGLYAVRVSKWHHHEFKCKHVEVSGNTITCAADPAPVH